MIEREDFPEKDIINPNLLDFEILYHAYDRKSSVLLPPNPKTLLDLMPVFERCLGIVKDFNKNLPSSERPYSSLVTAEGPTGRGKNTLTLLWGKYWLESISDWEEIRNSLVFSLKKIQTPTVYKPFTNDQLEQITTKWEYDLLEGLEAGSVFAVKPGAGTYGKLKLRAGVSIVERAFGPRSLYKLTRLQPPFSEIDRGKVIYSGSIALTASTFVSEILTRYRVALQLAGDDIEAVNEIREAFKKAPVKVVSKYESQVDLEEAREGGSKMQNDRTREAIRKVGTFFLRNHFSKYFSGGVNKFSVEILKLNLRGADDKEIINAASGEMQSEAYENAQFLSANPDFKLLKEFVLSIAYSEMEKVISKADLEIVEFYEPRVFEPLVSLVVKNNPPRNQYDKGPIREILKKYNLVEW